MKSKTNLINTKPYLEITKTIIEVISIALQKLNLSINVDIHLEHPDNEAYGDYSSNIALVLFPKYKDQYKSPSELAQKIIDQLAGNNSRLQINKISVAGPGFINFYLDQAYFTDEINNILENGNDYGKTGQFKNKKISVEYTDPNPFKEFHIGHLYSNLIGESISKILEANGAIVWRANFYGDVGLHIAKSIWGLRKKMLDEKISLDDISQKSVIERQNTLGQGYAIGVRAFESDAKAENEIRELNAFIYVAAQEMLKKNRNWQGIINYRQFIKDKEEELPEVQQIYETGLKWSLEYFESIYQKLGTKFDSYYPESWTGELGMKMVKAGLDKGVLTKSGDTIIYHGEQDGLHTRVFVNKFGLPTYETKDLGLAEAKYQDFKYDLSINIFGKEIDEYYKVVKAALTKINPEIGKKSSHLAHGMVNLPEGKMSSRSGNVITALELLELAIKQVRLIMTKSDLTESEKEEISETVAQGAVKYAFLKNRIGDNIIFDLKSSVTFEGNSGPYLQYTYARAKSVLAKVNFQNILINQLSLNPEELSILRYLYRFPDIVAQAGTDYTPNQICNYLYELAKRFNTFYNQHSIIKADSETQKNIRLKITSAVAQVLENGLRLLGIKAPEKM